MNSRLAYTMAGMLALLNWTVPAQSMSWSNFDGRIPEDNLSVKALVQSIQKKMGRRGIGARAIQSLEALPIAESTARAKLTVNYSASSGRNLEVTQRSTLFDLQRELDELRPKLRDMGLDEEVGYSGEYHINFLDDSGHAFQVTRFDRYFGQVPVGQQKKCTIMGGWWGQVSVWFVNKEDRSYPVGSGWVLQLVCRPREGYSYPITNTVYFSSPAELRGLTRNLEDLKPLIESTKKSVTY